jgi:hypothetical protein
VPQHRPLALVVGVLAGVVRRDVGVWVLVVGVLAGVVQRDVGV